MGVWGQFMQSPMARRFATIAASGVLFLTLCVLAPPLRAEQPQSNLSFATLQDSIQQAGAAAVSGGVEGIKCKT
jgi:HAMP domain-containing protein